DQLRLPFPPLAQYDAMQAFLSDTHVLPVLENRGISFRFRSRGASAADGIAFSLVALTRCSSYDSHHLGAGQDCQQYRGNHPTGSTNTCNSMGAASFGCTDMSIADPAVFGGFYTDLFQCCGGAAGLGAAEKACVPIAHGTTPCGTGGGFGCAV